MKLQFYANRDFAPDGINAAVRIFAGQPTGVCAEAIPLNNGI